MFTRNARLAHICTNCISMWSSFWKPCEKYIFLTDSLDNGEVPSTHLFKTVLFYQSNVFSPPIKNDFLCQLNSFSLLIKFILFANQTPFTLPIKFVFFVYQIYSFLLMELFSMPVKFVPFTNQNLFTLLRVAEDRGLTEYGQCDI